MATKARKKTGTGKKTRGTFTERVSKRVQKFGEWIEKTTPKFASAPKSDVSDALTSIGETLVTVAEALPKLNGWAPPSRSGKFAVGDVVVFKPAKAAELIEAGLYTKTDLNGEHEVVAVAGRKVKLAAGLFQSLYVTKAA
jgi:hypothetical protein